MGNFRGIDRDQSFLMPPDVRDWVDADDLAWSLIDAVGEMDLSPFYAVYRPDGRGAAAFDPRMMVTLLLYSYALGERSSRRIEKACRRDVGYRVVCANQVPDHTTISRFRQRFESELEWLFLESVRLCFQVGIGKVGTVAIDGRKVATDASLDANFTSEGLKKHIRRWFEESAKTDAEEDALYGADKRGDEVPEELRDPKSRRECFARAKAELDAEREAAERKQREKVDQHEAYKVEHGSYPRGRKPSVTLPERVERRLSRNVNITDPQSRIMKRRGGFLQGYNAQVTATVDQVVIAADVVTDNNDQHQFLPMLDQATANLERVGTQRRINRVLADAGYGTEDDLLAIERADEAPECYVAITGSNTDRSDRRNTPVKDPDSARGRMYTKMRTRIARQIYKQRCHSVETVFGHQQSGLRFDRFGRRGLQAARSEWHLINAIHNLKKRHIALTRAPKPA